MLHQYSISNRKLKLLHQHSMPRLNSLSKLSLYLILSLTFRSNSSRNLDLLLQSQAWHPLNMLAS